MPISSSSAVPTEKGWLAIEPVTNNEYILQHHVSTYACAFTEAMVVPDATPSLLNAVTFNVELVTGLVLKFTHYVQVGLMFNYDACCQNLAWQLSKGVMHANLPAVHDVTYSVEPLVQTIVVTNMGKEVRYDHRK